MDDQIKKEKSNIKKITELKNTHKGEDIYIIASGKSIDYYDLGFFDNKLLIGINQVYKKIDCDYLVRKEAKFLNESLETGSIVIISEYDSGNLYNTNKLNTNRTNHVNLYYFEHFNNLHDTIDIQVFGTDSIVVSYSTITSAMHIAAYMGAKNIILVGHDCGTLNNEMSFRGYYKGIQDTPWRNWEEYKKWLKGIEQQTVLTKKEIKKHYGANVISLNPFVSLNLENNIYL